MKPIACNSFPSLALFPSPQKIQPPPRLESDPDRLQSPICRQSLFLLLLSIGYSALGLCPLAFLLGLFLPATNEFPSLSHRRNHC
jgi:hypothetical protein